MAQRAVCALVAACALAGLPEDSGAGHPTNSGPRNLWCSKPCCQASCLINCSWELPGGLAEATSTLSFRYHNEGKEKRRTFRVGQATFFLLHQDQVYALTNATVWVETRTGDGRLLRSENRTLLIRGAIKFHRPAATFSRSQGLVTLTWPESHGCHFCTREKEARVRPRTAADWTRGNCNPGKEDGVKERAEIVCRLEGNVPYEIQVRFRVSHWSSLWSDWSESAFVPTEIFRSPQVNFTVGRLGGNGLRNVTLEWEGPSPDQGEVDYTLTFALLPCRGCPAEMEIFWVPVGSQTLYQVALSGAGYNVSLKASNKAGGAPASQLWIPPEQEAGPSILNVSLSGQNFTARWQAATDTAFFCFESQALGDPPAETPCGTEWLKAGSVHESPGVAKPNRCYRLAVHGLGRDTRVWSTFGVTHLFQRNTSLEDPIHVKVTRRTANSATVQWEPPSALSACPGVLKKYVICCREDEEGAQVTYYEASASERELAIPDLRPQMAYRVGVWASTDGDGRSCRARLLFLTDSPDSKLTARVLIFLSLGIFLVFLTAAGGFHFSKKRILDALWPPLPDPTGTEAVKILSVVEPAQVPRRKHFMEPLESRSPLDPFLVEGPAEKGEGSHVSLGATEDSPGLVPAVEELLPAKEDPLGSGEPLSSEYKAQGLLNPADEEQQGREAAGEPGGLSAPERC